MKPLRNHPGWLGAFTDDQAEGAIPNGTPIVKVKTEPGDGHLALRASGKAAVDAAHAAGLANGGAEDGPPERRPQYGRRCYAGYLRDPDGLRIELVSHR